MNYEEEFSSRCIERGLLKPTTERLLVVRKVFEQFKHDEELEADTLVEAIKTDHLRISRSTVFRTLYMLVDVGMLTRPDLDAFVFRFNVNQ